MKRFGIVVFGLVVIGGWMATDVVAQGRRGGGRGGMARGGGRSFGGQRGGRGSVGRTPSMSHGSFNRPSGRSPAGNRAGGRPSPGARPGGSRPGPGSRQGSGARPGGGSRPSQQGLQQFLDLPSGPAHASAPGRAPGGAPGRGQGGRPSAAGGLMAGGAAGAFLQHEPQGRLPGLQQGSGAGPRPESRPSPGSGQQLAQHRPSQVPNPQQWSQARQNRLGEINGQVAQQFPNRGEWFNQGYWADHPHPRYPYYNGAHGAAYWWHTPTWGAVGAWMPYGWSQPVSYNYGDNVYYQGDQVYSNGQPVASAEQYAQQAEQIATSEPTSMPADDDWMPLGVFALTPDGQSTGAAPTLFMQLTVSKQGVIAGTYQNRATGSNQSIAGMVDKTSQRAAWTVGDKTSPIVEAGISNLTQDSAPVLLHFADGRTQQWLLVRVPPPSDS